MTSPADAIHGPFQVPKTLAGASFTDQDEGTQRMFMGTHGDRADEQWRAERDAADAANLTQQQSPDRREAMPVEAPVTPLSFAQGESGKPYTGPIVGQKEADRYGTPGWDCSSLVQGAYKTQGIELPAFTDGIEATTRKWQTVPADKLEPGDILLYQYKDPDQKNVKFPHVGLYSGNGMMVDSSYSQGGVGEHKMLNHPFIARRPLAPQPTLQ